MILVTGGLGFQGSYLVKSLLKDGHEVRILARDSEHARRNFMNLFNVHNELRLCWGDITNYETVRAAMRDCSLVVHLAAQINVDESIRHPERSVAVNWMGSYNVLEAARANNIPVLFGSTCEVYGENINPENPMTEDHPMEPASPYAATKAGADRLAYSYWKTYELPVVITRPGNVYGWGQKSGKTGGVIPKFITRALDGKSLLINGTGEQGRDFIHIDDVIRGMRNIIDMGVEDLAGFTFNIGTGKNTSIKEIASVISELGGVDVEHVDPRPGEVESFALDSSFAKDFLGWEPEVTLDKGLKRTFDEAVKRGGF